MLRTLLGVLAVAISTSSLVAQGTRADYERAAGISRALAGKVVRAVDDVAWIDGGGLWYAVRHADGRTRYVTLDQANGTPRDLFDHAALAKAITDATGRERVDSERLPLARLLVTRDRVDAMQRESGTVVRMDRADGAWTTAGLSDLVAESHPFMWRESSDHAKGTSSGLVFVNNTPDELKLWWLSGDDRVPYGEVAAGTTRSQHTFGGHRWQVTKGDEVVFEGAALDEQTIVVLPYTKSQREQPANTKSDDKSRVRAAIREGNVVLIDGERESRLTDVKDRAQGWYSGPIEWSPDRTRFVARFVTPSQGRIVHIVESSPPDQVQPKLISFQYDKPGDAIEVWKPRLFDAETGSEIAIDDTLFKTPRMIDSLEWSSDSSFFSFVYTQRGHKIMRLVAIARDGTTSTIVEETPSTFVDVTNAKYFHRLGSTGKALWMSERDGWRHLYLIDERDGAARGIVRQLTKGPWVVRGVERVDEEAREVIIRAAGVYPQQDPYSIQYARVNMDDGSMTLLTDGDGTHEVEFSPDGSLLLARFSRVDMPTVTQIRDARTGKLVAELGRDDASALMAAGWRVPEPFVAKGRDGMTDIHGTIIRPTQFDTNRTYPVIEFIYAGPHGSHVPKAFSADLGFRQEMAELGFIIVQIDGMGTAHRSKAFHDVCFKNLKDAGLPDRIAWMRAAAAKYPQMDISRVGIVGGSAGGQNAMSALLHHGDFYDVAVADCGCHDNRVDKQWWNEAWMGYPVDESYADSSNVTHAHKLQGKLLLIVGEVDRNVDPASTMQVVNALIKADKDFDLLVMPGVGHGAAGTSYGQRRTMDFFVRHLLGVEPRREPVAE